MDALMHASALILAPVAMILAGAAAGAVAVFVAVTAWALVKPHIQHLIDAYIDWIERRTNL